MTMHKPKTYNNVPIETIKQFVLNKVNELDEIQLTRVYELISGNTCLQKGKDNCINILVNNEAAHPCDPRFGPPFPSNPQKHKDD